MVVHNTKNNLLSLQMLHNYLVGPDNMHVVAMNKKENLRRRRELYRLRKAEETPEERERRLARRRERDRARHAMVSVEQRQSILQLRREGHAHLSEVICVVLH